MVPLLLDATRFHAQVTRSDDNANTLRLQVFLEGIGDLIGQAFLNLQATGEGIDHTRQLAQSDDLAVRNISNGRRAEERGHVVLAMRIERNVLDDHHLVATIRAIFKGLE